MFVSPAASDTDCSCFVNRFWEDLSRNVEASLSEEPSWVESQVKMAELLISTIDYCQIFLDNKKVEDDCITFEDVSFAVD